jgi:phage I-like protein
MPYRTCIAALQARPRGELLAVLAANLALSPASDVQLVPAGAFAARDGRPGKGKSWTLTDTRGREIAWALTQLSAQTDFVFDVDHQTLRAAQNGQPAPAAGWARDFEWRPGQGLYALNVRWTEQARAWIQAGAYRYISPVITFSPEGEVTGVLMAAITNYPALLGMDALGQELAAQLAGQFDPDPSTEQHMSDALKKLLARLGLTETATEAEMLSAVEALAKPAAPALPAALCGVLGVQPGADEVAVMAALNAALLSSGQSSAQAMAALQGQFTALQAQINGQTVEALVEKALEDGQIVPAAKQAFIDIGKKDLAALQGVLAVQPKLPSGAQTGGKDPAPNGGTAALSADDHQILRRMGVSAEAYKAHIDSQAA